MTLSHFNRVLLLGASSVLFGIPAAHAQINDGQRSIADEVITDEIISVGTRRAGRTATQSVAPVDVVSGIEFLNQASNDVQELLRTSVPSYNVNTQPISDAATIIRPANLRGLSPDNTLVLLNGKRRHRGSVISFLGGGISDGAQGVDVSTIPAVALQQVEVLRDGASSQYGSDAIAGVINFELKDAAEGGIVEAVYGSTYDGDGDFYRVAGNVGLPIGDRGFVNLSGEYAEQDGTVRSVVRGDVAAIAAAGNTAVTDFETINTYTDEVPQYWGQPDVEDDIKLFVNAGFDITDGIELYGFGNYAERTVEGGFFYRNPTNRGGVYRGPSVDAEGNAGDDFASILVGDLDGVGTGGDCPAGIPLSQGGGLIADPDVLADVTADPNCFSFVETIPSGFVPRFGGNNSDYSVAGGLRGELAFGEGLSWDLSAVYGVSDTDFFIRNTINASLGPDTPRDFVPGAYKQTELILDAGFGYAVPVSGLASDLNIAFGAQWRTEEFEITQGDAASFALGPLADQGFSSSSNGFGGFTQNLEADQDSYAGYLDVEADITDALTVQGALRYEDYDDFGDTLDYKVGALLNVSDRFRVRGTVSTGFHAPTAGQANVTNVTTQNVGGVLIDQGTLPLNSGPGQFAADFIELRDGGRPELGTEESQNYTAGIGFDWGPMTVTADYFRIEVDDRIALSANVDFLEALNASGAQAGLDAFTTVNQGITELAAAGVIDRAEFTGFEDLTQFRYFTNSFDTRTEGVELVASVPLDIRPNGVSALTLAGAYIDTTVTDRGEINPISAGRELALEELLPELRWNMTLTHEEGRFRGLLRANYYGEWNDTGNGNGEQDKEIFIDAEIGYNAFENVEFIVGANNILDNFPEENPDARALGQLYPESSPGGFNGGSWYGKLRYTF